MNENITKIFITSIKVFFVFAILLGLIYPLGVTAAAKIFMKDKANGGLIHKDGTVIGSYKIGQNFKEDKYFHPRFSAVDYDASKSGGTNYGPSNQNYLKVIEKRIEQVRNENGIATNVNIPSDMVTASGSGLDPDITLENARLQSKRIAQKRKLSQNELDKIINDNIDKDFIGIWGQDSVNVVKLNIALDEYQNDKH